MKNFSLSNFFSLLMAISGLFLFFWLLGNQILTSDDLYFASKIRSYGPWEAMQLERELWNSRWTSLFLNFSILKIYHTISPLVLFFYGLFNGMLLLQLVYLVLNRFQIHSKILIALLCTFVFVGTFNVGEVWFWLASSTTYLTSTLLIGIIFLRLQQPHLPNWLGVLFIVPSIYIGGCSLPIAGLYILCLMFLIIKNLKREQPIHIQWIVLYLILSLLALLYLLNGTGSSIRMTHFDTISLFDAFVLNFKLTSLAIYTYLLPKLPILLLLSLPLWWIPIPHSAINSRKLTAEIIVIVFKFSIAFFCYQFLLTYITQDIGAARTLYPINLIFLWCFLGVIYWANRYLQSKQIPNIIKVFASLIAMSTILVITFQQLNFVNPYIKAVENRNQLLNTNKNQFYRLEALPPSGYLYSSEISVDSNHYNNQHLKSYFNLKYSPILQSE